METAAAVIATAENATATNLRLLPLEARRALIHLIDIYFSLRVGDACVKGKKRHMYASV
jgi:hypothetical protein